jgi:hypothetical protein
MPRIHAKSDFAIGGKPEPNGFLNWPKATVNTGAPIRVRHEAASEYLVQVSASAPRISRETSAMIDLPTFGPESRMGQTTPNAS